MPRYVAIPCASATAQPVSKVTFSQVGISRSARCSVVSLRWAFFHSPFAVLGLRPSSFRARSATRFSSGGVRASTGEASREDADSQDESEVALLQEAVARVEDVQLGHQPGGGQGLPAAVGLHLEEQLSWGVIASALLASKLRMARWLRSGSRLVALLGE